MSEDERPITLSREDLYELAWSKPMSELAKDFGISDVALAKRCKRLGIPVPGRGYWARVDAGQSPYRPKLPKREPEWHDQGALTVAPTVKLARSSEKIEPPECLELTESVRAHIAAISIQPAASILDVLPPVKRAATRLKHPRCSELIFDRGEKSGPIVDIKVSDDARDRALLLADSLLRAAAALGWTFVSPASPPAAEAIRRGSTVERQPVEPLIGRLLVNGEECELRIEERLREEVRQPSAHELAREKREYGYHAIRKVQVPTGALRVVRLDTYRVYGCPDRRTWYDRKGSRVEDQLQDILLGFYELAVSIKARRADDELKERKRREEERRRQDREACQEANAKLIKQLETDAGAWHRARYLRRYIHATRRRLGTQSLRAAFRDEVIDFLNWAEQYVNQMDPLHELPRSGLFERSGAHQYQTDIERMKNALARLLGGEWASAWKVGADYSPPKKSASDWLYSSRESSVFEVGDTVGDETTMASSGRRSTSVDD